MKFTITFLILLSMVFVPSCASGGDTAKLAQTYLEPYSFNISGSVVGMVAANSKYLVIDGESSAFVDFRHNGKVLWQKTFRKEAGKRAYMVVFGEDGKFADIQKTTWALARTSMTHLPPEVEE